MPCKRERSAVGIVQKNMATKFGDDDEYTKADPC